MSLLDLINPDGISYIAIAEHWIAGRLWDAINAYWSPFFSLAMVPWLALGAPPLLAAKLTLLLAAAALVFGCRTLVGIVSTDRLLRNAITVLVALLALEWSLTIVTPDVLAVAIFVWYLVALDRLRRIGSARAAVVCGLLGALLYLNKAVGLPLFLAHFTLATARPATVRQWLFGLATCVAGSLPWIAALGAKYGTVTLGTAGAHNWRLMGPAVNRFEPLWGGLFTPPNATATSVWEDPSAIAMPAWSAVTDPAHLLGLVERHGRVLVETLWARSPYVPIAVVVIAALAASYRDPRPRPAAVVRDAALGIGLVAAAALPFVVEERYVWTIPALTLVLAAYLIDRLSVRWPSLTATAIAVLALSIVPPSLSAFGTLRAVAADMGRYRAAAAELPPDLRGSRLAINPFSLETGGAPWTSWNDGLYLAWYGELRFYGVVPARADAATVERTLDAHGIATFVLVGNGPAPDYLRGFRDVVALPTIHARAFRRDAPAR